METKGIIIDKKDYDRLVEIEKNFDEKVKENRESFEKCLKELVKGNLVKILWVKDEVYADIMGCDLKSENIGRFVRSEDADMVTKSSNASYNRKDVFHAYVKAKNHNTIKEHNEIYGMYQEMIDKQRKTIRNLWWAFGLMFSAWGILLVKLIIIN